MNMETTETCAMAGAAIRTRSTDSWGSCSRNFKLEEKRSARYLTRSRSKDKIMDCQAPKRGSSYQKLSPTKLRTCPYIYDRSPPSEASQVVSDKQNSCISKKTPNRNSNESILEQCCMSFDDDQVEELRILANTYVPKASVTSDNVCDDVAMDNNIDLDAMVTNTKQSIYTHFNRTEATHHIHDTGDQKDAMNDRMISETKLYTWNNVDVASDSVRVENGFDNINHLRYTFSPRQQKASRPWTLNGKTHQKTYSEPALTCDKDLDTDTILAMSLSTSVPETRPTGVPKDFCDAPFGHTRRRGHFFWGWPKKEEKESVVYIQHKYATDDILGDKFGVEIWTDTSSKKDGYYRHFFQKVEEGTPADQMKIRNKDEIVLIDGHFVPNLKHEQIIELFERIPVDGVSRLELILRRKDTPRVGQEMKATWKWFQTSAILVPELNEEPKTTKVQYKPLTGNMYDFKTWQRYKLSGTQLFLTIDSSGMGADIIRGKPNDRSKLIQKHSRVCEDQHNPNKMVFMASLLCADETYYAMIDMPSESVVTTTTEQFFQWQKAGAEIYFKQHDLYLNCDNKTVSASTTKQMFEEFPMTGHKDVVDDVVDGKDDGYDSGSPPGTPPKRVTRSMSRQPSETTQCLISFNCLDPFRK